MTRITRLHVSWLQTSALTEIVSGAAGAAGTPSLGTMLDYTSAFPSTPDDGAPWVKPWGAYTTRHQYWSSLLGSAYSRANAQSAWIKQAPLRRSDGFAPTSSLVGVSVICERYLYPSGVGIAITATYEGDAPISAATILHRRLCQDPVFVASDGASRSIGGILLYELDTLESKVLGAPSAAPVSGRGPRMVTTIAGSSGETSSGEATATLRQLCYPGQPPGRTTVFPARGGNFTETIRVVGQDSQASWSPGRSTIRKGRDGMTCYHHNVVLSTLHTSQLLNLVELAGDEDRFANAPDRAQQLYKRAGSVLGWIYGGASTYSTRFSPAIIDESGLTSRVNRIRQRLSGEPPLHLRDA